MIEGDDEEETWYICYVDGWVFPSVLCRFQVTLGDLQDVHRKRPFGFKQKVLKLFYSYALLKLEEFLIITEMSLHFKHLLWN
jgi:hypothetical protein